MDLDQGKVTLFVNMTLEDSYSEETNQMIKDMKRILNKHNTAAAAGGESGGQKGGNLAVYA